MTDVLGPLPEVGLTVLGMERAQLLGKSTLTVRYDCCGRVGPLQYEGLRKKLSRYKRMREAGEIPSMLCQQCARISAARMLHLHTVRIPKNYFPLLDDNLGECVCHEPWPAPHHEAQP